MPICRYSFSLAFLFFAVEIVSFPTTVLAAGSRVCVTSEGKVVVKRRCNAKKGQTELSFELLASSVEGVVGPQGEVGEKGDKGETGDVGPEGPAGVVEIQYVDNDKFIPSFDTSTGNSVTAICPEGMIVVGGSCSSNNTYTHLYKSSFRLQGGRHFWDCGYANWVGGTANNVTISARAYCVADPSL